jgi:putative transposase
LPISRFVGIGFVKRKLVEPRRAPIWFARMTKGSPFRYFKTRHEIIHLAVMFYNRFPLSLRNVEDLLHKRGIDICRETVRFWWHWFGRMFAAMIRKRRVEGMRASQWRWHLDETLVKINGEWHHL